MPKLIYSGEHMAAAILEDDDITRVAEAMRYYVERVAWAKGDTERDEFQRILRDLTTPAPKP